jgi:hypothetical protein
MAGKYQIPILKSLIWHDWDLNPQSTSLWLRLEPKIYLTLTEAWTHNLPHSDWGLNPQSTSLWLRLEPTIYLTRACKPWHHQCCYISMYSIEIQDFNYKIQNLVSLYVIYGVFLFFLLFRLDQLGMWENPYDILVNKYKIPLGNTSK